jgi:hypothetical protein
VQCVLISLPHLQIETNHTDRLPYCTCSPLAYYSLNKLVVESITNLFFACFNINRPDPCCPVLLSSNLYVRACSSSCSASCHVYSGVIFYHLVESPALSLLPFSQKVFMEQSLFSLFSVPLLFFSLLGLYPAPKRTDGRTHAKSDVAFTFLSSRWLSFTITVSFILHALVSPFQGTWTATPGIVFRLCCITTLSV